MWLDRKFTTPKKGGATLQKKTRISKSSLIISLLVLASIGSIVVLAVLLEQVYSGPSVSIGSKPGSGGSAVGGVNSVATSLPEIAATVRPSPSPTPDDGLPFIEGFNTMVSLENIAVWWGDNTEGGKSSKDIYLRSAFQPLCKLLEEVTFTPEKGEIPMNFRLTYGKGKEQNLTVYQGNIATFPEFPNQYFRIPAVTAVGYGLLPSDDIPNTARARMEAATMLGYYATGAAYVELSQDTIAEVASLFFELDKTKLTKKPEDPGKQSAALVFYIASRKYYVNCYDGYLQYYGGGVLESWYSVNNEDVGAFLAPLK